MTHGSRSWRGEQPFDEVLRRAREGDGAAFASLWRWLHPAVLGWLRVVSPSDGEEAASEVWVGVCDGLHRFVGDDQDFRRWVFTIAHRRGVDQVRAARRLPAPVEFDEPVEPSDDPSIAVTDEAASREALGLLRDLPPAQREVVALRVVSGLSVGETAEVTGRSEGSVRVLCHRGLASLATLVGQTQGLPA